MPPGPIWKSTVNQLSSGLDKCREQIDQLTAMERVAPVQEALRKQIYSNGNTMVEVSVKTRKPSGKTTMKTKHTRQEEPKWGSILSDSSQIVPKPKLTNVKRAGHHKRQKEHHFHTVKSVESKRFAQSTKSSKAKSLVAKKKKEEESEDEHYVDEVDCNDAPIQQKQLHAFPSRTLQVFLHEMRVALKSEKYASQANKILDDLEFVAANLTQQQQQVVVPQTTQQESHIYELSLLKSEMKRLMAENQDLARKAASTNEIKEELKAKERKIGDLKTIVSRLTTNNNDMLAILSTKVHLEESLKKAETSNRKLAQELASERNNNFQLTTKVQSGEVEIARLHRIIDDLKGSLNRNLEDLESAAGGDRSIGKGDQKLLQETTIDTIELGLSTDAEKTVSPRRQDDEEDKDSAIGEGISESQPLSSNVDFKSVAQPLLLPPTPDESFRPAPLDLSETRTTTGLDQSSSAASHSKSLKEESTSTAKSAKVSTRGNEMMRKKQVVASAAETVDAKVASFLERMRTDKRFQVSLSSEFDRPPPPPTFDSKSEITGLTTDFDATSLNESKFRQGLEATLDLTTDD